MIARRASISFFSDIWLLPGGRIESENLRAERPLRTTPGAMHRGRAAGPRTNHSWVTETPRLGPIHVERISPYRVKCRRPDPAAGEIRRRSRHGVEHDL